MDRNTAIFLTTHSSLRVKIAELMPRVVTTELFLMTFEPSDRKGEEFCLMAVSYPYHPPSKNKIHELLMKWSENNSLVVDFSFLELVPSIVIVPGVDALA